MKTDNIVNFSNKRTLVGRLKKIRELDPKCV